MKHGYNKTIKIVAFLCVVLQIFVSVGLPTYATSDDYVNSTEVVNTGMTIDESSNSGIAPLSNGVDITPPELTYTISNPLDLNPNSVRIAFDATNVVDYSIESEGLTVVENQTTPMMFDLFATDDFGVFEIAAEMVDGQVVSKIVYTYSNDTSIFVSELSKDDAWQNCKQYEFDNGELTTDEWHIQYSSLSLSFTEIETDVVFPDYPEVEEAIDAGKVVIRGRMQWEASSGSIRPLRFAKVELRSNYGALSTCVATAFTYEDGYYYFIFTPEIWSIISDFEFDLFVRVYTEGSTFTVLQPNLEEFNYFDSPIVEGVTAESGTIDISRRLIQNDAIVQYRLFYIHQGMAVGEWFALDMGMVPDKRLFVYYVNNVKPIPELEEDLNQIAFCYDTISLIGHKKYNDFRVTVHEYGHYVENRMGNYGPNVKRQLFKRIPDSFEGKYILLADFMSFLNQVKEDYLNYIKDDYYHIFGDNHFEEDTTKAFQMELTWSESWAETFGNSTSYIFTIQHGGL